MRKSRPIQMYVPSLAVEELKRYLKVNSPDFKYNEIYFYFIIQRIALGFLQKKKLEQLTNPDYVELNMKYLRKSSVSNINLYVKMLLDSGIVISDHSYLNGSKSKGYQINSEYLACGGVSIVEIPPHTKLFKKEIRRQYDKRAHDYRMPDYLRQMKRAFMKVELDYNKAEKWIEGHIYPKKQIGHYNALLRLQDKRFRYFKRNTTNKRLDSNLTNLKKEIKSFIVDEYVNIDLSNSQPFLLSQLLDQLLFPFKDSICLYFRDERLIKVFGIKVIKKIRELHLNLKKSDLEKFISFFSSVRDGLIYEVFMNAIPGITRDDVKAMLFGVLYSRNSIEKNRKMIKPYAKQKALFKRFFPFVLKASELLKGNKHQRLSVFLQGLESYLFIDLIAKDLVEAGIVPLTIHDSVIVETKDQEKALEIIHRVFLENFGVIPTFHIKNLKSIEN